MNPKLLDIETAIITERTVVRRFREGEGTAFYQLIRANYPRLTDHFPLTVKEVVNEQNGEFFIRRKLAAWLLQEEFCFGIWDKQSAAMIGYFRVFRIDWRVPKAELGFFLDKSFAEKGIMTEVLSAMMDYTFEQLLFERVYIRTAMDNYATQRLARKCGLQREGDLRSDFRKPSGELVDVLMYGLSRTTREKI